MIATRSFVLLLLFLLPAEASPADAPPLDPVVADVLRMLGEKVPERVLLAYLETERRRPEPLSPDAIIVLTRAGATPAVVEMLMELAKAPPPADAAQPRSRQDTPGNEPEPAQGKVEFHLTFVADKGERLDDPWDLYAYVDGEPVAWSTGRGGFIGADSISFTEWIPAGAHRMVLLFERHDARKGGAPRHEAIVCPEPVTFTVVAGAMQSLHVKVRESWALPLRGGGALSYTFTDASGTVESREHLAGDPDDWPHLCDEVQASNPPGEKPTRAARRQLEGCRHWAELWPPGAPSREQVRRALADVDYRPVPAGAR